MGMGVARALVKLHTQQTKGNREQFKLVRKVAQAANIQEVKARGGQILAIVTEGDTKVRALADHVIEVPKVHEALSPLLTVLPMQLLSYHIALIRGCNVDQPRNLAKSVTVE